MTPNLTLTSILKWSSKFTWKSREPKLQNPFVRRYRYRAKTVTENMHLRGEMLGLVVVPQKPNNLSRGNTFYWIVYPDMLEKTLVGSTHVHFVREPSSTKWSKGVYLWFYTRLRLFIHLQSSSIKKPMWVPSHAWCDSNKTTDGLAK